MSAIRRPVALVTGGRRGIGRGIALALAGAGFDVIVNDVVEDQAGEDTLAALAAAGARAVMLVHDVSDVAGHAAFVERTWNQFGAVDCLVNNAGVQVRHRGDLLEDTPEEFDRIMGTNLRGPYFLTSAVSRRMISAGDAEGLHRSVVNVASSNSFLASVNRGSYCLSKAAVSMMTKLFALRLAPHGIAVNEVRPGVIRTDMTAGVRADYDERISAGLTPVRRWGEAGDVGAAVAALARGALPFITGDALHVDGGLHVHSF